MLLTQGSTTATFHVDSDSYWSREQRKTVHQVIGASTGVIQTDKFNDKMRKLDGWVTDAASYDTMEDLYGSQATCVLTGDQAGDVATVYIYDLKWERQFDVRNWLRKRFSMVLVLR